MNGYEGGGKEEGDLPDTYFANLFVNGSDVVIFRNRIPHEKQASFEGSAKEVVM